MLFVNPSLEASTAVVTTTAAARITAQRDDLAVNVASWLRHLRAENLSPATIVTYTQSVARLAEFLEANGMPLDVAAIRREHVESFMEDLLERFRPATAANRYSGLQPFFKWLVDEGEIRESPMARMRKPKVPEAPPPILTEDELRQLLKAIAGKGFDDRRDEAIVRLFIGTGARLSELANLRWNPADPIHNDVDLDAGLVRVLGKGRRERTVYVGNEATRALDRYIRARSKHRAVALPWLWLGPKGRFTSTGIGQMIKRRGAQAGMPHVHAHLFRHGWAHAMLGEGGMTEGDVMQLGGWRSRETLGRYAAATRSERAIAAARRFNPGDKL